MPGKPKGRAGEGWVGAQESPHNEATRVKTTTRGTLQAVKKENNPCKVVTIKELENVYWGRERTKGYNLKNSFE